MNKEESTRDGKPLIHYYLTAVGLPTDKGYYLWFKTLANPMPVQALPLETTIDSAGYVVIGSTRVTVSAYGCAKGEAIEFALVTKDKSAAAIGRIIPFPIETRQGPYRVWVELISTKRTVFVIWGEGFEPSSEIETISTSENEVMKSKTKTDSKGRFTAIILPAVIGKECGAATYAAIGKSGEVKVSYQWGPPALNPEP